MNVGIGYLHVGIQNAVVRDGPNCISVLAAEPISRIISNYEASVSAPLNP